VWSVSIRRYDGLGAVDVNGFPEIWFKDFSGRDPASSTELKQVEEVLQRKLPLDFREFLSQTNGGEGFIGDNYLIVWGTAELAEMNHSYEAAEMIPGMLIFGSSGGGEAYCFDYRSQAVQVVRVPFIGMCLEDAKLMAANFRDFLGNLSK